MKCSVNNTKFTISQFTYSCIWCQIRAEFCLWQSHLIIINQRWNVSNLEQKNVNLSEVDVFCGRRGIRTPGTVTRTAV